MYHVTLWTGMYWNIWLIPYCEKATISYGIKLKPIAAQSLGEVLLLLRTLWQSL